VTSKIFIHKGKRLVVEPHVILNSRNGLMGRLAMVQTHPVEMRTNAWAVIAIRANFDYESIDRVPLKDNDELGLCIHIADAIATSARAMQNCGKKPKWNMSTLAADAVDRFMAANGIRSDDPQSSDWKRRSIDLMDMYANQGWPFVGTTTEDTVPIFQLSVTSRKGKTGDERDTRISPCLSACPLSAQEMARASLHHQAHWTERDAYNNSYYHDQYGTNDM